MPISFSCGQCRKDYVVSDGLAGKKAICKQCGNRMVVPGSEFAPVAQAVSRPLSARPVATPQPQTRPKAIPRAKLVEPKNDVYGFDEAPSALPPLMPQRSATDEPAEPPVRKKKRKAGFFASGGAKKSAGSYGRAGGLSGGNVIGLVVLVVSGVIGTAVTLGLSSKSEVLAFQTRIAERFESLVVQLVAIRDADAARQASPKCQEIIEAMIKDFESVRHKKARLEDIKAVERDIMPRINASSNQLNQEFLRLRAIPGAMESLNIQGPVLRLMAVANEIEAENRKLGVQ